MTRVGPTRRNAQTVTAMRRRLKEITAKRRDEARKTGHMSLVSHLAELRYRVIISAIAVFIGSIAAFFLWDWILSTATAPYCAAQQARNVSDNNCQLYITNPVELLTTRVTVSLCLGAVFAIPVLALQVWRFITPGLNPKEKRYAVPFVLSSIVLFVLGAAVAWIVIPKALSFFLAVGGDQIETLFNPTPYLKLIFMMMLLFGLAFETPLLLVFLQLAHVVTSKQLRGVRRYAIVINSLIAAFATPGSDPYSMLAMFIPLCIFYEVAILVGRSLKR